MSKYDDAELEALQKHPDCKCAVSVNGLDCFLRLTIVVKLWRNDDCYLAGDPPKYVVEGYPNA